MFKSLNAYYLDMYPAIFGSKRDQRIEGGHNYEPLHLVYLPSVRSSLYLHNNRLCFAAEH